MASKPRSMEYASRVLFTGMLTFLFSFAIEASGNDIPYRHYSIQDGLPHENVSAIEQTPDGRIWVGTSAGLSFNTGRQFKAVRFLGAIGTVNVREIEPTENNEVWVATNHQGIWKARFEHAKKTIRTTFERTCSKTHRKKRFIICVYPGRALGCIS